MDYSFFTAEKIVDRFGSLPANLKDVLGAESYTQLARQICRSNYLLEEEKILVVEQLTALALLGYLRPEELGGEIAAALHLNPKAAGAVADEINQKIFLPIKDDLASIYAPLRGGAAPGAPAPVRLGGGMNLGILETVRESAALTKEEKIKKLRGSSIQEKIAILKEAMAGGYVNEVPNLEEHLKENEFRLYGEDKTYQEIADRSGFSLKNLVKGRRAVAGGPQETGEVVKKIEAYFRRLPDPGELDSFFRGAGALPPGTSPEEARDIQREIVLGTASGFSPELVAQFFLKLLKKNYLDNFAQAARQANLGEKDFAPENLAWLTYQAGRPLGVDPQLFGLK